MVVRLIGCAAAKVRLISPPIKPGSFTEQLSTAISKVTHQIICPPFPKATCEHFARGFQMCLLFILMTAEKLQRRHSTLKTEITSTEM